MKLKSITIDNYRGIKKLFVEFDDVTVLIGENNTGKTTILEALHTCLSRSLTRKGSAFTNLDYHLTDADSQPPDADPICITLKFYETQENEWSDEIIQQLSGGIVQVEDDGLQSITLQVKSQYDTNSGDFMTQWDFLDRAGIPLASNTKHPRNIIYLQQLAPVFYLSALRDAAQEFRPKSSFWGPFVKALKLEESEKENLEQKLYELNQTILDSHSGFEEIKESLQEVSKHIPLSSDDPVSIEALPARAFEMLSKTQVMLKSKTGARLPINRHGEGTQSLAVLALFDAFLKNRLQEKYDDFTEPVLTLEEPEAHLHPSAIRSVATLLQKMKGQKIISTHSGDLVSSVDLFSLRRLRRVNGEITAFQLSQGILSDDEINKLNYQVRAARGDLLFARCWLLVEGQTEFMIFNECARILGEDLCNSGVFCVEFAQSTPDCLLKLANALGIDWIFQADGDADGNKYVQIASQYLNGRASSGHIIQLPEDNMELFMCKKGFGYIFETRISPQKANSVTAAQGTDDYWRQVIKARERSFTKPRAAMEIISEIEQQGEAVIPTELTEIIRNAIAISRNAL